MAEYIDIVSVKAAVTSGALKVEVNEIGNILLIDPRSHESVKIGEVPAASWPKTGRTTPEYIDREAALQALKSEGITRNMRAYKKVQDIQAADVASVRHGRWIWDDDGYLRCSRCIKKAPVLTQYQDEPVTTTTNYCPNCGAKMDGEEGENGRM